MPNDKIFETQLLYEAEISNVKESAEKWKDFLDFSAQLQISKNQNEYEFSSKLLIHAKNPNATDCRTFNEWKSDNGNHVKFNETGLPVLSRNSRGNKGVAYLFDTTQTAIPKEPERFMLSEESKATLKNVIDYTISALSESPAFSDEQRRIFLETADYKLCKQYGIETNESISRFSGIENLSVKDIAEIGIALNKCNQEVLTAIERNDINVYERDGRELENGRTELHGRESRGMDLGGGISQTRQEVQVRHGLESVVQAESGERNIRTDSRTSEAEADSSNGQVRKSETELHMADTLLSRSDNAERGRNEALRGNERESYGSDSGERGEEESFSGISEDNGRRTVSADVTGDTDVHGRSGGGNTSRDGLRNINDETAEPEKVSAIFDENIYIQSFDYADKNGEIDKFLQSHNENMRCLWDIKATAEIYYETDKLDDFLNDMTEKHGTDRLLYVLSRNIQQDSSRFSPEAVEIANNFEFFDIGSVHSFSHMYVTDINPSAIDSMVIKLNAMKQPLEKTVESIEYTEKEMDFLNDDISAFMAKSVLSWDEIEDLSYRFYEDGYIDRFKPSEKAMYGNGLEEPELYEIAHRMHNGEDVRAELAKALLGNQTTFSPTYDDSYTVKHGDESLTVRYGNAEKEISYETIGTAFFSLIEKEYNDITLERSIDELKAVLPDTSDEKAKELITAFDEHRMEGWKDNGIKQTRIKKALYDILDDDELTEKAFAAIADMRYNFKVEVEQKLPDSLEFQFGERGSDDSWFTESGLLYDFVENNPNPSFALSNAIIEYLDEKQHFERDIDGLNAGWYKKTKFDISAVIDGESFHYEGRFDIGDGKGTGGGSLIDHIRDFNEGALNSESYPYNNDKAKSNLNRTLDIFVPFLEAHSELTAEETKLLNEYKAAHPIEENTTVYDFKRKTEALFNTINGYRPEDIENAVRDYVSETFSDNDVNALIGRIAVSGSRSRRMEHENSDIDVVIEVSSELKEDALFNLLNEDGMEIDGITVDINPIRAEESGTLENYLPTVEQYLAEKRAISSQQEISEPINVHSEKTEGQEMASSFDIPTIDESLRNDFRSGKLTFEDVANELSNANLIPHANDYSRTAEILGKDAIVSQLDSTLDKYYINKDTERLTQVSFNPDSSEGGQLVYIDIDFDMLREALESDSPADYIYSNGKTSFTDITDEQFIYDAAEFLANNEAFNNRDNSVIDEISKLVNSVENAQSIEAHQNDSIGDNDGGTYSIYQFKEGEDFHYHRFSNSETLEKMGYSPNVADYELKYTGNLSDISGSNKLEGIYYMFNMERPADFTGHSLSVSDIVVIEEHGEKTAHFVDSAGYTEMPEFFNERALENEKPEQQYNNSISNLNQLKKALQKGSEFDITDHIRPECIGEHRKVTSVNTVGFYSQPVDESGELTGKETYMEWSKAKNWTFDNGICSSRLDNDELVMSFRVYEAQPEQELSNIETSMDDFVTARNLEAVEKIEVGDEITLKDDVYIVKSINGDFMMSAEKKNIDDSNFNESIKSFIGDWKKQLVDEAENTPIFVIKPDVAKALEENARAESETKAVRTADDIEIGDKYNYKDREYTVVSMQGVYPDDVGISYDEKLSNGTTYAVTENVNKQKLEREGVYLGKSDELAQESKAIEYSEVTRSMYHTDNPDVLKIKGRGSLAKIDITPTEELWNRLAEKGIVRTDESVDRIIFNTDSQNWNKLVIPDKWGNMTNNIDIDKVFTENEVRIAKSVADDVISPTVEGDQLSMFDMENKPYQVVTYDRDSGADDKLEYATLQEAESAGEDYIEDGYDGYAVYNKDTKIIETSTFSFPVEKVFSEEVLRKNGYIVDEIKAPTEEAPKVTLLDNNSSVDEVVSAFGLDKEQFKALLDKNNYKFGHIDIIRLEKLETTVDIDKAKGYFEAVEGSYLSNMKIKAETHNFLYNYIENNAVANSQELDRIAESEYVENKLSEKAQELDKTVPIAPDKEKPKKDYFRINNDNLGEGSKREKFNNNIEAIRTLLKIDEEERLATPEEQEIMSKYVGWGGIQEAFDNSNADWRNEYNTLKELLSEEEYEAARSTVNDAFYTSPVITKAIYEGLSNIGFEGGEILEPALGVGNFFGTMPDKMRENSNLAGVEIDSISGRIAQKLYPEANIAVNGYEKVDLSKGSFDLAIGNVPFGNYGVNDNKKAYKGLLIHDYFFAKSLDNIRSGGIVAFVTSTGTLDKEDTKVRQMLAQKAELMGAVRLPNNAFQKNAGTATSTDIIFLKKRDKLLNLSEMSMDKSCDWVHTKENADGFKINSYFADNPDMILGNLSDKGRFGTIICTPIPNADLGEQLHEAMKNIKGEYTPLEFQSELDEKAVDNFLEATPDVENLTYTVVDDKLYYRVEDNLVPLKESEQHGVIAERRKGMLSIAGTVRELLQAQVEDRPDSEIKALQAEMNSKYDKYVKKFGRINPVEVPNEKSKSGVSRKSANSNAFKNDVRLPLLQSLEKMKDGQFIGKSEIFTERTIRPRKVAEHVETAHEALILSVSEKGKIDFNYMEQLTGFDRNKIIDDLHGDIYPVPELSTEDNTVYQTKDEYLSGNIYKKIAEAEAKVAENPAYMENVAALKEVIPTPLKATEIDMQLGMSWIDPKIIQQFMYETFETPDRFKEYDSSIAQKNPSAITVDFLGAGNGVWNIDNAKIDNSVKATKVFGTKDLNAYQILEKLLNSKSITITETYKDNEGKTKTKLLENETRAAEDKAKKIGEEFKKWIFADPERRNKLVSTYNEKFNCIRPREYDGSNLNFFGSNPEITLKPHQKNAVAHALFGGNTLFAHQVGAGKTFEMIATAMEGKRLGLHNKSMFVVPKHLTEQIGADFMKLYPNANILVAKSDDFTPQKRRQMCARIATGNFDAVIIGHSQLIKIPLSPKREADFIRKQIAETSAALEAAQETDSKSYTVKELEQMKKKLRERLEKLTNGTVKDNAVTFEELGVDKIFIDEAHEFKNLFISTKMENVSGLSTNANVQKTADLYMKCQYLDELTGSKGIVFSTGTPVTNALSEMFTTMKYLQSDLLKETGLDSFDSWAGTFTTKSTELEISPSGSDWRNKTRLKFVNVPELITMFKECADIKMADQLNLDVPECEKHIVSVEPTEAQKAVVNSLAERAERISSGAVNRTEDNMLVVTGDGRKLGLDQRLYDLNLPDEPQTKLNSCIQNVYDIWNDNADKKSTQLVFCDLGVPQSKEDLKKNGKRFDVYADIRDKLIEKGVPEKEIAFIHDFDSDAEKAKLFAKVRNGDVRVLIGSTQKMGAGTNVQDKLIALHDLDCPWRPSDLTQRLGRMVRQGNENEKVDNYRYVTKGTFDAYLYQMVEKKQKTISQIFNSKKLARSYDDIDDMAVDLMQVKMAAVGDERVKRQMELHEEVRRLKGLKKTYLDAKYEIEDNIQRLPNKIANTEKTIENIATDIKTIKEYTAPKDIDGNEMFEMKIDYTIFNDKKEAAEALKLEMARAAMGNPNKVVEVAEYKGFKIGVSYDSFTKTQKGYLKGENTYSFEFGNSEIGNITRIENAISAVPARMDVVCNELERLKEELADNKKEVNLPFEHEEELVETQKELDRITDEINADKVNGKIAPEQPESTEKSEEQSKNLNLKWQQNGKEMHLAYNADENTVIAYSNGKEEGRCSPNELTVTKIEANEQKNYPADINNCVKSLNIAFSSNTARYVSDFADKVKNAEKENSRSEKPLFSREKIMSDEFKPTSEKDKEKPPTQNLGD